MKDLWCEEGGRRPVRRNTIAEGRAQQSEFFPSNKEQKGLFLLKSKTRRVPVIAGLAEEWISIDKKVTTAAKKPGGGGVRKRKEERRNWVS